MKPTLFIFWILASTALFAIELKDPKTQNVTPAELVKKMFQFEQRMNDRSALKLQLLAHPEFKSETELSPGPIKQAKSLAKYLSSTNTKFVLKSVKFRKNGISEDEWVSFYSCTDLNTNTILDKTIAAIWVESKTLGWYLSAMSL